MLLFDPPGEVARQWISLLDQLEARVQPEVAKALAKGWRRAAGGVPMDRVSEELTTAMAAILLKHYRRTFRSIGRWVLDQRPRNMKALRDIEIKSILDTFLSQQEVFLANQALVTAAGVAETNASRIVLFLNGLRSIISRPGPQAEFAPIVQDVARALKVAPGRAQRILADEISQLTMGTMPEQEAGAAIQRVLANKGVQVSQARANAIARTETAKAADWAGAEAMKRHEADGVVVVGYQWVTAADHRVRHSHRHVRVITPDGQTFDTETIPEGGLRDGDYFGTPRFPDGVTGPRQPWPALRVGGGNRFVTGLGNVCDGPRDPSLPAADVINCRCVRVALVDPSQYRPRGRR